jgi:hypothetical protein
MKEEELIMKKYSATIEIKKHTFYEIQTELVIEAENQEEAEIEIESMLDSFQYPAFTADLDAPRSSERLAKCCKNDILKFHLDPQYLVDSEIANAELLDIEEIEEEEVK